MLAFLRSHFRWIAGGFLLTYFSSLGQTFFVSASAEEWREAFGLSHGGFGRLYMAATLASALTLPFIGRLVDVMPESRAIALTAPLLALAALGAAYAPNVWLLGLSIYGLRLFGQGMMTHIALTATGRWFSAQRGRAVSLVVLGHQGGEFSLPIAFAAISLAYGYQAGWAVAAAALIVVGAPLAAWAYARPRVPSAHEQGHRDAARQWTRAEVLADPIFWVLLVGVLAPPFIGTSIFFHQDYLTNLRGWPPHLFALGFSLMAVSTIVFALLNGALIDRRGAKASLPYFLLPLGAACFAASLAEGAAGLFVFMGLLGVSYGASSTLFGALWPEIYGARHLGAVRSVIVAAMVLATALGPGLTGTLIDAGIGLPIQFAAMGAYCLAAAAAMTFAAARLKRRVLAAGEDPVRAAL